MYFNYFCSKDISLNGFLRILILCGFVVREWLKGKAILSRFKNECTENAPQKRYFTKRLFSCFAKWVHFKYAGYIGAYNRHCVFIVKWYVSSACF